MAMRNALVLCIMAAVFIALVEGDASATPTTICNVKVSELAECIPAITGNPPPWPTHSCCLVMGKANLHCLCNYKGELAKLGIDPTKAAAVPRKCGRKLPRHCTRKSLH